jgi:hypothetical protein
MTWQDLVNGIRKEINDPDQVRWSDGDILAAVILTRQELWGLHSEAFCVSSVVTEIPADPSDSSMTSTIDFLPTWAEAVRAHVLWQLFMEERDESQNVIQAENWFKVWLAKVRV